MGGNSRLGGKRGHEQAKMRLKGQPGTAPKAGHGRPGPSGEKKRRKEKEREREREREREKKGRRWFFQGASARVLQRMSTVLVRCPRGHGLSLGSQKQQAWPAQASPKQAQSKPPQT